MLRRRGAQALPTESRRNEAAAGHTYVRGQGSTKGGGDAFGVDL